MKIKALLISSTAIALLTATGVAMAAGDNNYSRLIQNGAANSASVSQDGNNNRLNSGTQTADKNSLSVSQDSSGSGLGNTVGTIAQTGAAGASGPTNVLTVVQNSDDATAAGNKVTSVIQSNLVPGTVNTLSISQIGDNNVVDYARQYGSNNIAHMLQDGSDNQARLSMGTALVPVTGNTLDLLEQTGSGQKAFVSITGNNNGGGYLNDTFVSLLPNVPASRIIQGDANNYVNMQIAGSNNQFGITQGTPAGGGAGNTVGTIVINGFGNQLAIEQHNDDNLLGLAAINGDDNDIAVAQDGGTQTASVDVAGSNNHALVQQYNDSYVNNNKATLNIDGFDNYSMIAQIGGHNNTATVTSVGNDNYTGAIQTGESSTATISVNGANNGLFGIQTAGTGNTMSASVVGSNNNTPANPFTGFGSGAATALVATAPEMSSLLPSGVVTDLNSKFHLTIGKSLQPGLLVQAGDSNKLDLRVGNLATSDGNLFATVQHGDSNDVTGRVNGNNNQAAILQAGDFNTANFTQTGNGNVAAISQ